MVESFHVALFMLLLLLWSLLGNIQNLSINVSNVLFYFFYIV